MSDPKLHDARVNVSIKSNLIRKYKRSTMVGRASAKVSSINLELVQENVPDQKNDVYKWKMHVTFLRGNYTVNDVRLFIFSCYEHRGSD